MRFSPRLRSFFVAPVARRRARQVERPHPIRSCLPRLEPLEDRTQPSTFTVTNLNDHGAGSLRAAIEEAGNGDIIVFAKNVRGDIVLTTGELSMTSSTTIEGPGA